MTTAPQSQLPGSAETAYLFRHAMLRDAAYQLQLPADRARLHKLALEIVEAIFSGRPTDPLLDGQWDDPAPSAPIDPLAIELALHARFAAASHPEYSDRELLYLVRAARFAGRQHRTKDALSAWQQAAEKAGTSIHARAGALHHASVNAQMCGDRRLAATLSDRAVAVLTEHFGNGESAPDVMKRLLAEALCTRASLHVSTGELQLARDCSSRARHLRVLAKDRLGEARAIKEIADIHLSCNERREAESLLRHVLGTAREQCQRMLEASCLISLGNTCVALGRVDEAEAHYLAARKIYASTPEREPVASLGQLATLYTQTGRVAQALEAHRGALELAIRQGDLGRQCAINCNIGVALQMLGRLEEAESHYRQALSAALENGDYRIESQVTGNMATLLNRLKRFAEAESFYVRAIEIARRLKSRNLEALWLGNLGATKLDEDKPDEALKWLEQALAISEEISDVRYCGLWTGLIAQVFAIRREFAKAAHLREKGNAMLDSVKDSAFKQTLEEALLEIIEKRKLPPVAQWKSHEG